MSSMYDYSDAQPNTFEIIPAKTQVPVIFAVRAGDQGTPENAFTITKSGLYQLTLEVTVTEGDYAGRKIFQRLTMGAKEGVALTAGQETAVNISKQMLRAILEAARGFAPTDDSPAAIEARKMKSIFELDKLECWVEVGIEKDKTGEYGDKNKVARILPAKPDGAPRPATKPAAPAKKAAWA